MKQGTAQQPRTGHDRGSGHRVGASFLWFAVLGGSSAWGVHLLVAWSVMEVSCFGPAASSTMIEQRAGSPGWSAWAWTIGGTVLPWLVAAAAAAAAVVLHRRCGRMQRDMVSDGSAAADSLATERTRFVAVLGIFLNFMALAAITGGGIAMLVLEPCG